jgi:hypothetical protein
MVQLLRVLLVCSIVYYGYAQTVPLITGGGRSATHTLAKWLSRTGVPAVHENAQKGKVSVSWLYAPVNATKNSPLGTDKFHFYPVVHIMREPLAHIRSVARCLCGSGDLSRGGRWDRISFEYASRYIAIPPGASRVTKAAWYWLEWNRLADAHANAIFRIEQLHVVEASTALLHALHIPTKGLSVTPAMQVHAAASQNVEDKPLTWKTLKAEVGMELTEAIRQQAESWGYTY